MFTKTILLLPLAVCYGSLVVEEQLQSTTMKPSLGTSQSPNDSSDSLPLFGSLAGAQPLDNLNINSSQNTATDQMAQISAADQIMTQNTAKDQMSQNTAAYLISQNTAADQMAQNTVYDKTAKNTGTDQIAKNTVYNQIGQNTGTDQRAENTVYNQMGQNTGTNQRAENTVYNQMGQNTGTDQRAENTVYNQMGQNTALNQRAHISPANQMSQFNLASGLTNLIRGALGALKPRAESPAPINPMLGGLFPSGGAVQPVRLPVTPPRLNLFSMFNPLSLMFSGSGRGGPFNMLFPGMMMRMMENMFELF